MMTRHRISAFPLGLLMLSGSIILPAQEAEHERHAGVAEQHAGHEGHAEHEAGGDTHRVHLTEAQRRRLQLSIDQAGRGSAEAVLSLPATVEFDADRVARIGPRLRAKVLRVSRDLGDTVSAGEPVALMDSVALGKTKARYLTARARLETESANYAREKKLAAQNITSDAALLEARATYREAQAELNATAEELRLYGLTHEDIKAIPASGEIPLSHYVLTSPIDGVVQARDLVPGQTVGPEATPIHVVDPSRLWVMIEAYERDIPLLEVGQPVRVEVRALPDQPFSGRIDWISRALDPQSRTLRVRVVVDNPDGLLRAGMFATAHIQTDAEDVTAMLPVDAVQTVAGRPVVFVPADEEGAFHAVPVTLGHESGGRVEVVAGIQPGQSVVVAGAFDLKSVMTAGGRSAAHSH